MLHRLLITPKERCLVKGEPKGVCVQLARQRLLQRCPGLFRPVERELHPSQVSLYHRAVRLQADAILGLPQCLLPLAQPHVVVSHVGGRDAISGIALLPQFVGLAGLVQFSGNEAVVGGTDPVLLAFAHPVPQVVGLLRILARQCGLSKIAVDNSEIAVSKGEVGIELNRTPVIGKARHSALLVEYLSAHAEGLQCF